ncbi:MAG: 6-phosphogluconolactonase [bacterium]
MESGLRGEVRVFSDASALTHAVARALVGTLRAAAAGAGLCSVALPGGNTPRALYRLLGSAYRDALPWETVHIFWGDERYVPADDPRSNYRMAKEEWLDHIAIVPENVHPMPTALADADEAARRYEATLRAHFRGRVRGFDLVLLGLGPDGHTASLFPGSPALEERSRWVIPVRAPVEPSARLTLTLPMINHAAAVWFLVLGADKAEVLRKTLGSEAKRDLPAARVRPQQGALIWWVDAAATALLAEGQPREAPRSNS